MASACAPGVVAERVLVGEHRGPSDGWEVGGARGGEVSGRASRLCLRALGNMGPGTALPDGAADGGVRPWCRGERPGVARGVGGLMAAAFGGAGVRVARGGWQMGGGVVECGSRSVPGLAIIALALDCERPAIGVLDGAGG